MGFTSELLAAWGCPAKYQADHPVPADYHRTAAERAVSSAANWYPEMNGALHAMVDDVEALREWRDSSMWEAISLDEDSDPETAEDYVAAVRAAFDAMIEEA